MQIRNKLLTTLPIAGALALAGCGGSSESTSQEVGTLRVAMTDAPACGFDAVHVTVTRIRVHRSETTGRCIGHRDAERAHFLRSRFGGTAAPG